MGIEARAARNEALYREVNERISELMATFRVPDDELVGFLCECDAGECQATVSLSLTEYRAVRAHPRHFALVGSHVDRRVERVVRETDRFAVVEKEGEAGELVEDAA
jgi:hypothetical protein